MTQRTAESHDVLEVAFTPTVDDHVQVLRETINRGRRRWWTLFFPLVLVANVVIGVVKHGPAALFGDAGLCLLVLLLVAAAWFGGPVWARWMFARRATREPWLLAPMAFRFAADGVRVKSLGGVSSVPWSSVAGVRETRHLFFFEIGSNTSQYVPRRALGDDGAGRLRRILVARLGARARVHETNGR